MRGPLCRTSNLWRRACQVQAWGEDWEQLV